MDNKTLYIKNMVCDRCKMAVQQVLDKNALPYTSVELGEVELAQPLNTEQLSKFKEDIETIGFELIEDKTSKIISSIKTSVIDFVRNSDESRKLKLSVYLAEQLGKDYNYLSSLFSSIEGTTIEQYFIHQKIELVKELIVYDELSLSEIAYKTGYSSIQHLSNQFKKVTGLTPTHFKQVKENRRKPLDQV
ncbi:helix-turn-helix domain-containing protein [Chryseosolibacter indicus]|uniref:AraC family transcriptional regulator n=1 Tax=Chryseosolibacter indicus TaxID=2782351 RepID=A0ABS5VYU2_9BACT|nr:AraC family transcriptional regulator [Chryseosolibacter indicus]MBT1705919.1 AraC family transcriptional regulator [Chryseosolibacter indicus]